LRAEAIEGWRIVEISLQSVCGAWKTRLEQARKHKRDCFDTYVDEALAFYVGADDAEAFYSKYMEGPKGIHHNSAEHAPGFRIVPMKLAELVQLFGPSLYHRNPVRTVTPRKQKLRPRELVVDPALEQQFQELQGQYQQMAEGGDPQMLQQLQQLLEQLGQTLQEQDQAYRMLTQKYAAAERNRVARADLFDQLLNYTPNELDLMGEMRLVLVETLIKGMGCLWPESIERGGVNLVGSFFDTVDHLLVDPDMETWRDVRWISRLCVSGVDELASRYGVSAAELRSKSTGKSWFEFGDDTHRREKGELESESGGDLVVYQKVFSRMGLGRLKNLDDRVRRVLEGLGEHIYLVLAQGYDYPLNLPPTLIEAVIEAEDAVAADPEDEEALQTLNDAMQQIQMAVAWPIPTWKDGRFPVQMFYFHTIPNSIWPMAHIRPGMPQLKWLAYSMNHLADRAQHSSRMIFGLKEGLEEENKRKLESGDPITVVKVSEGSGRIEDYLSVLQLPQTGAAELMRVTAEIQDSFEKATGLTEMSYGTLGGSRSAAESNFRQSALNVRPDDMANKVEEAMTGEARLEALASAWLLEGSDVAALLGEDAGQLWTELVEPLSLDQLVLELDFRIEAGSARKPNRETQVSAMNETMQVVGPMVSQLVSMGQPGPWNALIQEWARVNEITDVERFLVPPPPPPQPQEPPQPDPNLQMQQQLLQQKGQMEMQKMQMDMQMQQAEAELRRQQLGLKVQSEQLQLQLQSARFAQEQQQDQLKHELSMGRELDKQALNEQEERRRAESN